MLSLTMINKVENDRAICPKTISLFLNHLLIDVKMHLLYHLEHIWGNFVLIPMGQLIVTVTVKLF